ncbi:hypothetical protein IVA88_09165 [Bradyrhizobium sp. 149]|uniref:hypothetical protein n=1 Tax=Bradyrhizobium sp. 149 TaxID=2782624 RepID=UPI001FFB89D7|nr:hypothetical protein [Bradyrhizobium sp. 149]MCK1651601.1 hypothetical protein [Bradyrhizobium sp. 149]
METNLRAARVEASIKGSDAHRFLACVSSWVEGLFYIQSLGQSFREFSPLDPTYGEIEPAPPEKFADPNGQRLLANALFGFGIAASLQGRPQALQALYAAIPEQHYSPDLSRLAGVMAGALEPRPRTKRSKARSIRSQHERRTFSRMTSLWQP